VLVPPVPQRVLPSLKVEQTNPSWQSSSVVQPSHSSPLVHPVTGSSKSRERRRKRDRRIGMNMIPSLFDPNAARSLEKWPPPKT
jgi:hypothetical protein